jgi:hypothetical protein
MAHEGGHIHGGEDQLFHFCETRCVIFVAGFLFNVLNQGKAAGIVAISVPYRLV